METITIKTAAHATQIDMKKFEEQMLAAEANGVVDTIEVPAQKPDSRIVVKKSIRRSIRGLLKYELIFRENQPVTMNRRGLQMMYAPYMHQFKEVYGENFFDYNINYGISSAYLGWGDGFDFKDVPYDTEVIGKYAKLAKFLKDIIWDNLGYIREWIYSCNGNGVGTVNVGGHYPWYEDVVKMQMSAHRLNNKAHALKLKTMEKHGRWIKKESAVKLVLECPTMPISKLATVAAAKSLGLETTITQEKLSLVNQFTSTVDPLEYKGGWGHNWQKKAPEGKIWMVRKIHSFQVSRDSLALREVAKRASEKGEVLVLEEPTPVGGRATKRVVMKRVGNIHWRKTTLFSYHGDPQEYLLDGYNPRGYWDAYSWIPFLQKIPIDISSEDEALILEHKDLVIFQPKLVGGQEVVDVKKTLANIAKFKKSKEVELEGVNLRVLREFTRNGYKFQFGWQLEYENNVLKALFSKPQIISVKEVATGEIYQTSSKTISEALRYAVDAFEKRAAAKVLQQEVEEVAIPEKGVLVYLQDSYAVGNCQVGAEAWMREMGFSGKKIVPLHEVHAAAEASNNNLARNVVKFVVAKYLAANKEVA